MPYDKIQPSSMYDQTPNISASSPKYECRGKDTFFNSFNKNSNEGAHRRKQTGTRNYNSLSETPDLRTRIKEDNFKNHRYIIL